MLNGLQRVLEFSIHTNNIQLHKTIYLFFPFQVLFIHIKIDLHQSSRSSSVHYPVYHKIICVVSSFLRNTLHQSGSTIKVLPHQPCLAADGPGGATPLFSYSHTYITSTCNLGWLKWWCKCGHLPLGQVWPAKDHEGNSTDKGRPHPPTSTRSRTQ